MNCSKTNILFVAILLVLISSCKIQDPVSEPEPDPTIFKKLTEYQTEIPEPSGLTLDANHNYLWTVSDNTNSVYKIDLKGNTIKTLNFIGEDLEGIVFDSSDGTLWLAEEQLRQIVHIDTNGIELERFDISNLQGSGNSGIEGICIDESHNFIVLNEKEPPLWAKLDSNFAASLIKNIEGIEDLSGITYYDEDMFLIVSDQSQKLFLWSETEGILSQISLDFQKAEGVAYCETKNKIYIISDLTGKLYVFEER